MSWPTRQHYREALQAPDLVLVDQELRAAAVLLDKQQMPRALAGQNATVFSLQLGGRRWAVKCFARHIPDQQQRYAAISQSLGQAGLQCTVPFEYQAQGIRVGSNLHPIVKMEWIDGENLKAFIGRSLQNPIALKAVAREFLRIAEDLQAAGIAHGDLQHGNILVSGSRLRLVDYDGMYVPSIAGLGACEAGHRDYQHPLRALDTFDPRMDVFSVWVIVLSLLALSEDPRLWTNTGAQSEGLLFSRKDFEEPDASGTLKRLMQMADPDLNLLATQFQLLLYSSPNGIPLPSPTGLLGSPARVLQPGAKARADWIESHKPANVLRPVGASQPLGPSAGTAADWIMSMMPSATAPAFQNSPRTQRWVIAVVLAVAGGLAIACAFGTVTPVLAVCLILGLCMPGVFVSWTEYGKEPDVGRRRDAADIIQAARAELRRARAAVSGHEKAAAARRREDAREVVTLESRVRGRAQAEATALSTRYAQRDSRLKDLAKERAKVDLEEGRELQVVCRASAARVRSLDASIASESAKLASELASALKSLQDDHIRGYLSRKPIVAGEISGIGSGLSRDLRVAGIGTAADVTYYSVMAVQGIGTSRAGNLMAWRQSLEAQAARRAPQALPAQSEAAVRSKYSTHLQQLASDRALAGAEHQREEQGVRVRYIVRKSGISGEEEAAKTAADREAADIRARSNAERLALDESLRKTRQTGAEAAVRDATRLRSLQKDLAEANWRVKLAERDATAFGELTFGRYLRWVVSSERSIG